jgi:Transposase DDE domain
MTKTPASKNIVPYLTALLWAPWKFQVTFMSGIVKISHDKLMRALRSKVDWKLLLLSALNKFNLNTGYLILDETEINKNYCRYLKCGSWLFSHKNSNYFFGLYIVLVCWTNGKIKIPIAWKVYQKHSGKTKIDLSIELINYCMYRLLIRPKAWLFDSFYTAEKVLKVLHQRNEKYYSQLSSSRLFNGVQLKNFKGIKPYWVKTGTIKGGLVVQVTKRGNKFYITNDIGVSRKIQLATYKIRWEIEEIFRFVKSSLGFEKCQSTSLATQHNHIGSCLFLYTILQDIAAKKQITEYAIKKRVVSDRRFVTQAVISSYFVSA